MSKRFKPVLLSNLTRTIYALHHYDSILVIEKKQINEPQSIIKGKE
jgi:hypothetical protein